MCLRPVIPVLFALMGGLIVGRFEPSQLGAVSLLLFACLLIRFLVFRHKSFGDMMIALFFVLGYWSLQNWVAPSHPANHVSRFLACNQSDQFEKSPWHITGIVKEPPEYLPGQVRFVMNVLSLGRHNVNQEAGPAWPLSAQFNVQGNIQVSAPSIPFDIAVGDQIACMAQLKEFRSFKNPGAFDYSQYMQFRGIHAYARLRDPNQLILLRPSNRFDVRQLFHNARMRVSKLIDQACEGDSRALLKALVVGLQREISPRVKEIFNRTGCSHVLAISGSNVGLVAGIIFWAFRLLLARSKTLLLTSWADRCAALLTCGPVICYGLLVGFSASTERAIIMVMLFLAGRFMAREHDQLNLLAIAALLILIVDPPALFDVSFQLSFVAVLAIILALRRFPVQRDRDLSGRRQLLGRRLLNQLWLLILVTAAATIGTLPLTLYYFNQFSVIGLAANCVIVPIVGCVVVPLGLAAATVMTFWPAAAFWMMKGAGLVMASALYMAEVASNLPYASLRTVTPTLFEICLFYTLIWCLLWIWRSRLSKPAIKTIVVALGLTIAADVSYWAISRFGSRFGSRFKPQNLIITVIDVGNASAALIELPGGKCMLIDGGGSANDLTNDQFDVGERVVAPLLWRKKIATVDTVVLSHPHPDHFKGLTFIVKQFGPKQIWMTGEKGVDPSFQDFLKELERHRVRQVRLDASCPPIITRGVEFRVIHPAKDFLERSKIDRRLDENSKSLVLKATFGQTSFLFPADIEEPAETELVRRWPRLLDSDVLLVPHHGSKRSSTAEFLSAVSPRFAVVSSQIKAKGYALAPEVLDRYRETNAQIFHTGIHGAIEMTTDEKNIRIKPFKDYPRLNQ